MRGEWEGFREALQYGRRHGKGLKGLMLILRKVKRKMPKKRMILKEPGRTRKESGEQNLTHLEVETRP